MVGSCQLRVCQLSGERLTCARVSSSGEVQPSRHSDSASSSRRSSRTCRTPSSPATVRPKTGARPTRTARAPSAERLRDIGATPDAAVEVDLDASPDRVGHLWQRIERGRTPSSCRPPWFETTTPAAPCSTASSASSAVTTPLRTTGSCPSLAIHSRSAPRDRGVEQRELVGRVLGSVADRGPGVRERQVEGTSNPTRRSRSRCASRGVSTVRTTALQPALQRPRDARASRLGLQDVELAPLHELG